MPYTKVNKIKYGFIRNKACKSLRKKRQDNLNNVFYICNTWLQSQQSSIKP